MTRKTYKELEVKFNWKPACIVLLCLMVWFFLLLLIFPSLQYKYRELKQQLSECQDKIPETWSCPVLLEKGMYSLRDGGILISPTGIEIKCSKVPVLIWDGYCYTTDLGDYTKSVCPYNHGLFNFTYIFPKIIDEIGYWDRDMSKCRLEYLWNEGEGRTNISDYLEWKKENCEVIE